jgi:hypothetical protein
MSSLLEQAIADAKLLKETARRNAEAALIDQFADRIKENMDQLLEQDDLGLDDATDSEEGDSGFEMPPLEAAPVTGAEVAKPAPEIEKIINKIPASFLGEDNLQEVEINLDSIIEKIDALEKDLNMKTPDFSALAHDAKAHDNVEHVPSGGLEESLEEECLEEGGCQEEEEEEESLEETETLDEELVVDLENVSPGGINANETELRKQYNVIQALEAQNEEINEELSAKYAELESMETKLESALSRLKETRLKLNKSAVLNTTLKEGFELLTKKINDVNVLNSRLLYTNKILGNSSLNERQKKQIAESISKAKSVEEAKTIYETLQRSADVVTERKTAPKSLTEAINRSPSAFLPRVNTSVDPNVDRWQRIAGIKK